MPPKLLRSVSSAVSRGKNLLARNLSHRHHDDGPSEESSKPWTTKVKDGWRSFIRKSSSSSRDYSYDFKKREDKPVATMVKKITTIHDLPKHAVLVAFDSSYCSRLSAWFTVTLLMTHGVDEEENAIVRVRRAKVFVRKESNMVEGEFHIDASGKRIFLPHGNNSAQAEMMAWIESMRFVSEILPELPPEMYSDGIIFQTDNFEERNKIENCMLQRPILEGGVYHSNRKLNELMLEVKACMDGAVHQLDGNVEYSIAHVVRKYNKVPDLFAKYAQTPKSTVVDSRDEIEYGNRDLKTKEVELTPEIIDQACNEYEVKSALYEFMGK